MLHYDIRNKLKPGSILGLSFDIRRPAFCHALQGTEVHQFMRLPDLLERGRYIRTYIQERQAERKQKNCNALFYREFFLFNGRAKGGRRISPSDTIDQPPQRRRKVNETDAKREEPKDPA